MRDLSLPKVEKHFFETNTEKPTTEGDLHFLEELLQHRDLRHLSLDQKNRRSELIAALVDYIRIVSYTATYYSSRQKSELSKPYALIGHLVIRTASSHQSDGILKAGFESPSENAPLRAWANECGLSGQELALLLHPESISEPGHHHGGISPAFDGLWKASAARRSGEKDQLMAVSEKEFEGGAGATNASSASRPEYDGAPSHYWGLRDIPVGETPGQPLLRAILVPTYSGEPLIALTFSRSF